MRIALVWPRPRAHRWQQGRIAPAEFPDGSDAFLFLEHKGLDVVIEDSCGVPFNPLVRMHEFYSGLTPCGPCGWRRACGNTTPRFASAMRPRSS